MKKYLSLLSIPVLMTLNSCLQEDIVKNSGEEITAKVNITLPGNGVQSRAVTGPVTDYSGMRLYLAIYYGDKIVKTIDKTGVNFSGTVTEDIRLVAGKTYKIAAWADFGSEYYTITNGTVALQDTEVTGNDSKNDAFYAFDEDVTLDATNTTVSLNLKRPFGLVQVTTNDWADVVGTKPTSYSTTMNVPTQLDLTTGTVSNPNDVTFSGTITDGNAATQLLSYDYILAGETKSPLQDFTVTYSNGTKAEDITYEFNNIPVQRNYITNVSGNVLTKKSNLSVSVNNVWDEVITIVTNGDELASAIENAQDGEIIKLDNDMDLKPVSYNFGEGVEVGIDLNNKTLNFEDETNIDDITVTSGTLRISGGTITGTKSGSVDGGFVATGQGKIILENINYNTNGCALFIKEEGEISIENSTIDAGAYAVTSNASSSDQNITFTAKGCTLAAETPILLNVPSNITINDCIVTGTTQGSVIRGGTATIENSTITLECNDEDYEFFRDYFLTANWGSGNMVNVAALTLGNKSKESYRYPTNVMLKNTQLKLSGAYGMEFPALYVYANPEEGNGVTLVYDEQCVFDKEPEYGSSNITVNGVEIQK